MQCYTTILEAVEIKTKTDLLSAKIDPHKYTKIKNTLEIKEWYIYD